MSGASARPIRVSYVAVTRNRRTFVERALHAWKAIKGPQDELVVVDGASVDGTFEMLRDAEPGLIDCLVHETDRSEAHALNRGMLRARGSLIKPISDDDEYFPEGLEKAYSVMLSRPEIEILNTGGENVFVNASGEDELHSFQSAPAGWSPFWRLNLCGVGLVIRREALAVIGLIDPRHKLADHSLNIQAHLRGARIRFLQVKTYRHRSHEESLSVTIQPRIECEYSRMYRDLGVPPSFRLVRGFQTLTLGGWSLPFLLQSAIHPGFALRKVGHKLLPSLVGRPVPIEPVWDERLY